MPGTWLKEAGNATQRRRFTGTVGAQETKDLAGLGQETHIVYGQQLAVFFQQSLYFDHKEVLLGGLSFVRRGYLRIDIFPAQNQKIQGNRGRIGSIPARSVSDVLVSASSCLSARRGSALGAGLRTPPLPRARRGSPDPAAPSTEGLPPPPSPTNPAFSTTSHHAPSLFSQHPADEKRQSSGCLISPLIRQLFAREFAQVRIEMKKVDALRDDFAGPFGDKYRQPFEHRVGDTEESAISAKALSFHRHNITGDEAGAKNDGIGSWEGEPIAQETFGRGSVGVRDFAEHRRNGPRPLSAASQMELLNGRFMI